MQWSYGQIRFWCNIPSFFERMNPGSYFFCLLVNNLLTFYFSLLICKLSYWAEDKRFGGEVGITK